MQGFPCREGRRAEWGVPKFSAERRKARMQTNTEIRAAILAGGTSRRMGTNKALLRLQPNSPSIIEIVVTRLTEAGLGTPLLVTNTPQEYAFLGVESVPDDIEGASTLGGILTALNHAQTSRVLVVGCDMPWLNAHLLRYMVSLPGHYDALVPRWSDRGQARVEPLHAIYSQSCIATIQQQIKDRKPESECPARSHKRQIFERGRDKRI